MGKRIGSVLVVVFIFGSYSVWATISPAQMSLYVGAYDSYLDGVVDDESFYGPLERFLTATSKHPEQGEATYWKGRALFLLGMAEIERGNDEEAEMRFRDVARTADMLIENSDMERGYCLKADAKSQILLVRGLLYKIRNAGEVVTLAETVLDMNPNNVRARLLVARRRVSAPRLFGGNTAEGIDMLVSILEQSKRDLELTAQDRLWVYLALGAAYAKTKQQDLARSTYELALALYPHNREALELKSDL